MATRFLAVLAIVLCASSPAFAAGSAKAGRQLAATLCLGCHAMSESSTASDSVPPFSFVARDATPARVRAWLMDPHPPMQGINLSRRQIDDIVAYLVSLSSK